MARNTISSSSGGTPAITSPGAGTRGTVPANPLPQLDEGASALATAMWLIAVVLCALGVGGIGWWVGGGLFH